MKENALTKLRKRIAAFLDPKSAPVPRMGSRMYLGAQASRLTSGWASIQTSADSEISTSIRTLRSRNRALVRDAGFAKRAKTIVVNNIVGPGIGFQSMVKTTRGDLNKRVNAEIESGRRSWCSADSCHTGGRLFMGELERFCMGQVFEAGEVFIRKHYRTFGRSKVPFCLEVIEPERVLDEYQPSPEHTQGRVRMGVETDEFHRPIAYWIRTLHPGDNRFASPVDIDRVERVPADQIIHLSVIERWPQTRGVPWMHTAVRKLNDLDGYSEAEIIAARGGANYMGIRKLSKDRPEETLSDGSREMTLEPGIVEDIYNDEEFIFANPNRPNSGAEPFLRFLLREMAAGIGVSYESLSRDYSQSNYSSSRLALLDDRDLWRIFQLWFIESFCVPVHREWLQQAVLSRAIASVPVDSYALDPANFEQVRWKPRGWSWIDPAKEVEAYKEAIKAGLTTRTDVIAKTADGRDVEDIDTERSEELKDAKALGLVYDTDPDVFDKQPALAKPAAGDSSVMVGGKQNAGTKN